MALRIGRTPGESVVIGDIVTVTLLRADNGALRLEIDAPKEISIARGEIYEQQQEFGDALQEFADTHKRVTQSR